MEEKQLVFELKIDNQDSITGVYAISLVTSPAIEKNFIAFNKDKQSIKLSVDTERRIVTGPVLIPNQYIYRRDSRGEYYVYMSEETIHSIVEKFHKAGFTFNITHQHQFPLYGNVVIESWTIKDPSMDKSVLLGYNDLPVGTWFVSMKIEDEVYWQDYIKTGELKGFSIEGIFNEIMGEQEQVKQNKEIKQIKQQLFMLNFNTTYKLVDGTEVTVNEDYTVSLTDGSLLPDGTYELEDGTMFEVYYTYLAVLLPPVWDDISAAESAGSGLFSKVKQIFGLKTKAKQVKETMSKEKVKQVKQGKQKTNLAEVTTTDGTVVVVDDNTMKTDVVDSSGMVIGYLEFVPTETMPAPDSTEQSEQVQAMMKQFSELQASFAKLSKENEEMSKIIKEAVPNKVEQTKSDFETNGDFLSNFINQRKTN